MFARFAKRTLVSVLLKQSQHLPSHHNHFRGAGNNGALSHAQYWIKVGAEAAPVIGFFAAGSSFVGFLIAREMDRPSIEENTGRFQRFASAPTHRAPPASSVQWDK